MKTAQQAEQELRPMLTPLFMDTLYQLIKTVGWGVDMIETVRLLNAACEMAGIEEPDQIEPYPYEEET
jgi:hypothetical protein